MKKRRVSGGMGLGFLRPVEYVVLHLQRPLHRPIGSFSSGEVLGSKGGVGRRRRGEGRLQLHSGEAFHIVKLGEGGLGLLAAFAGIHPVATRE